MDDNLRRIFNGKLDEIREQKPHCTIQWADTKKYQVISQEHLRLSPLESPQIHVTYTIDFEDRRRYGTVLAIGSKKECEATLYKYSPEQSNEGRSDSSSASKLVDDLLLMKILSRLLSHRDTDEGGDSHHAQCSNCQINPIRHLDRYHCLECSTSYDLCGRCFEKRRHSGEHLTGHAMIHLKLPNEFLGISISSLNYDLSLNRIKHINSLCYEKHEGIKCDGTCQQSQIFGLRFKCDTCPNYNLCENCALKHHVCTKMHERSHPMILTSNRVIPKIDPDDVQLGEVLGRGGFGFVCVAHWKSKNRQVACKIIEISSNTQSSHDLQRSFLLELAAYRELSGPYILRTYAYATRELPGTRLRSPKTQYMILMELMGRGSLQNLLENEPNQISLRRKLAMARQIASAMRRIHQHGMIHRDIRPDNILVTDDYVAKIGDMGIARVLDPLGKQTQMGCLQFMPPEFFQNSDHGYVKCDEKLDIFTYGLTINQLFTEVTHEAKADLTGTKITLRKISPIFYEDIIKKCLESNAKLRPTAIEIEKILQFYEQAFTETMLTDSYTNMNTKEKDRVFLQFYQNNHTKIQRFFQEKVVQEIPISIHRKEKHSPAHPSAQPPSELNCRQS